MNLIQYFIKLLWQGNKESKIIIMKFLNSICIYDKEGISIVQEKIYKLYFNYCRCINERPPLLNLKM